MWRRGQESSISAPTPDEKKRKMEQRSIEITDKALCTSMRRMAGQDPQAFVNVNWLTGEFGIPLHYFSLGEFISQNYIPLLLASPYWKHSSTCIQSLCESPSNYGRSEYFEFKLFCKRNERAVVYSSLTAWIAYFPECILGYHPCHLLSQQGK